MPCAAELEDSKSFRPSLRWEQGRDRHPRKAVQPNTCQEAPDPEAGSPPPFVALP